MKETTPLLNCKNIKFHNVEHTHTHTLTLFELPHPVQDIQHSPIFSAAALDASILSQSSHSRVQRCAVWSLKSRTSDHYDRFLGRIENLREKKTTTDLIRVLFSNTNSTQIAVIQ